MVASAEALHEDIATRVEEIAALTEVLVGIDSPTSSVKGVREVQEVLARELSASGFDIAFTAVGDAGHAVLDATRIFGEGPTVLVLGHADTVWPLGAAATWPFERAAGIWRGPGVGDMKACLAMAIHAYSAYATAEIATRGTIRFLVIPDEEAGSAASRALIEAASITSNACLTLEAARPGGGLVTSRGAVGAMSIETLGRAVHVTDPKPHQDALAPLIRLATRIADLSVPDAIATVGVLRAGTARQIVAEHGELLVDLRASTTSACEHLADRIRESVERERQAGVEVTLAGGVTRPAFPRLPGTVALYERAAEVARRLGQPVHEVAERGGSDASFAAALGIPTLDGVSPVCHESCSRNEYVDERSVPIFGAMLAALIGHVLER